MRLEAATRKPPPGVEALLADLGDGENGFGGTPVPSGKATLDEATRVLDDLGQVEIAIAEMKAALW